MTFTSSIYPVTEQMWVDVSFLLYMPPCPIRHLDLPSPALVWPQTEHGKVRVELGSAEWGGVELTTWWRGMDLSETNSEGRHRVSTTPRHRSDVASINLSEY